MSLQDLHFTKPIHDGLALVAAVAATFSVHNLADWLQVAVLFLTIVFLCLGIVLRFMKIKDDTDRD